MKRLLQRSRYFGIWLAVLPLLLAFASYRTSSEHIESVQATLATDRFLTGLNDLLSAVKDAETGERGYLLTGRDYYLDPYRHALPAIDRELSEVTASAAQNGVDPKRIKQIRELIGRKMAELRLTIRLRTDSGAEAALDEVNTGRGQEYMELIRELIQDITREQRTTLGIRVKHQRQSQTLLDLVLGIGVAAGFLLLYFWQRFNSMYVEERDRADHEARRTNESLELRVRERTVDLEAQARELEKRTADLQRSNQDLLQFAYIASHDLQEPLRTIGSFVGLLARRYGDQLDESAKKYIEFTIDGASRMQALINDLLSYSRAGTQLLQKTIVPADRVVETALNNLYLTIRETNAEVRYADLPSIDADEMKLTQVMQNLIANAIKFRKPEAFPEVTIRATRDSDMWLFAVSDNGIGFDKKYTDRIFEVFQRLHGLGRYPGNGIGLAICRRIIEHHGGRLWAESHPGIGSTFFFTLPDGERDTHQPSAATAATLDKVAKNVANV